MSYAEQARLAGAEPVVIQTEPGSWKLTPDLLRQQLTPRSRLLSLCTPSNPTGIVYTDGELAALAEVLAESQAGVLIDEIYARISYVPVGRWLRAVPDFAPRTLIVDGVSKAYAMTGWRLGWLVGPQPVIAAASAIQSHLSSHPSSVSQRAAVYALGTDAAVESTIGEMVRTFKQRRDAICAGLNAIDGVSCPVPDGRLLRLSRRPRPVRSAARRTRHCAAVVERAGRLPARRSARLGGAGRGLRRTRLHPLLVRAEHGRAERRRAPHAAHPGYDEAR